ncbi:Tat pathway signal sequence domain protein [Pelagicoccus albus]|uniref:Tat pathway signal sequence domain protein n=1 Tax=Pelagicoccus albus TaxID=415222 RepID=A0A7X1E8P9_9BACT|nr:Tat pathway signal sequence domain protein [Pelagicoccus albus]MBC2605017.1 Tat pathway signal sequence domain protein [Pelagicoccus albus]
MNRRDFLIKSAFAAAVPLAMSGTTQSLFARPATKKPKAGEKAISWLDGEAPEAMEGSTWGLPWPQGELQTEDALTLKNEAGEELPLQTWTTAYWPDGSVKWTGHAIAATSAASQTLFVAKGNPVKPASPTLVTDRGAYLTVETGPIRCVIPAHGDVIFTSIERNGRAMAENARLIGYRQSKPEFEAGEAHDTESFLGRTKKVEIEQSGPVRAVIKVTGTHLTPAGREWLPFTLRLYFYAGSESVRMSHTFVYDTDGKSDFIKGMGLRFDVPMVDEQHQRHVRFAGEGKGLWGEAIRGITGLRRDPGQAVREAQIAGLPTPPLEEWDERVSSRMQYIPTWGDFSLSQESANGFTLRKRTKPGHGWIDVDQGNRAAGVAYIGGISGGVLFGMRDFWQLHPAKLDIRNANTDLAEATVWIWSPDAPAMDTRFYHDGMGMDTYEEQYDGGLAITYEDYEPDLGSAYGVARTTDFTLCVVEATPSRERTTALAESISMPAMLTATPEYYLASGVFGSLWSLPDRSTEAKKEIEDRLDWAVQYYKSQIEQRHWYGFWNYGDVMHTYDRDRHVWRYDVGGFAWDNSELSPDLWLWYSFLRTGRRDDFRIAEAMTRHNRDVDIYHVGKYAGLGSRHNVQHWGCSAKQLRISTSAYRRFHYFLTADERTGDVLNEVTEADRQLANLVPTRKLKGRTATPSATRMGIGTDFGSTAANWLTAWERTGDPKYGGWLKDAMSKIGGHPLGFFAGDFGYNPDTKKLLPPEHSQPGVSHLSAVFGLVEICAELIQLIDDDSFRDAWLQYCTLYNAPAEEQKAVLGTSFRPNLVQAHSRLTAYAAQQTDNKKLAERAWVEFSKEWGGKKTIGTNHLEGPNVLNPVDEAAWVSTNDSSQWGLAAIQNLALASEAQ